MRLVFKIHVLSVMVALFFGTLMTSAVPHQDHVPERDAGCHSHGKNPEQVPVSYRCCQTGHGSALMPSVGETCPELQAFFVSNATDLAVIRAESRIFDSPALSAGEPPGLSPLRI